MTAKPASAAEAPHRFLKSLYAFVRDHLAVVNGLVLASGSACAAIEAVAPGLPLLTQAIRAGTALIVVLVVVLALAPRVAARSRREMAEQVGEPRGSEAATVVAPARHRQLLLWEEGIAGAEPAQQ